MVKMQQQQNVVKSLVVVALLAIVFAPLSSPTKISPQAYNHQTTSRPSNRPRRITSRRTTTTTHLLLYVPWASLTVVDSFIHSMENTIFGHMSSSQIIVSIIMLYNNDDDDEPPTGQPTKGQATWNSKQ